MVTDTIRKLKNPILAERNAALNELTKLGRSGTLSIDDARMLIESAGDEYPQPENEWEDYGVRLLWSARDAAKDKEPAALLQVVETIFARLNPQQKAAALQIVTLARTAAAGELYARLLLEHATELKSQVVLEFRADAGANEVAKGLFPGLLELLSNEDFGELAMSTLLGYRTADLVPPDVAAPYAALLAAKLRTEVEIAESLQRSAGLGWRDEPPYSNHRLRIGLMFDLAGVLDSKELLDVVRRVNGLVDPRLRRFRAVTMLRRGLAVADDELARIAESPRDRYWLHRQLEQIGAKDRWPTSCRDQALLAEGAMVDWLCFGTELGREPDEIELLCKEMRPKSAGPKVLSWLKKREPVDYYFFKYRVTEEHWSKADGWMVGMAGGYARSDQPTTRHDGGTFSKFGKLAEKTLAEHVADYLS